MSDNNPWYTEWWEEAGDYMGEWGDQILDPIYKAQSMHPYDVISGGANAAADIASKAANMTASGVMSMAALPYDADKTISALRNQTDPSRPGYRERTEPSRRPAKTSG